MNTIAGTSIGLISILLCVSRAVHWIVNIYILLNTVPTNKTKCKINGYVEVHY